jgi:L-threonylcarbamoyladenylate synthase
VTTLLLDARDPAAIQQAAGIIRRGGLVAFPTETVYGLGANALDASAVQRIFAAKERPAWDPIIVHLASREMLAFVASSLPPRFEELFSRFMPGPLTVLMQKLTSVPDEVTAGRPLVAVRFPKHQIAQQLISGADLPIAAPSANRFGRTSPTTAQHVLADLDGRIDAVLDGGPTIVGVESTVLDLVADPPAILREGAVTREQLESVLGRVQLRTNSEVNTADQGRAAPGMSPRHYAPHARLVLIEGGEAQLRAEAANYPSPGILLPSGWTPDVGARLASPARPTAVTFDWGPWNDPAQLAARLYAGLRWLDDQGVSVIIAPLPENQGLGAVIRDRLQRAAR